MRGFIEAYERLKAAEATPRSQEWFDERKKALRDAEYQAKVQKLRKSVA